MAPIISVQNLGKRYVIGQHGGADDGLRHRLEEAVRSPWRWLRQQRSKRRAEQGDFWALKDVSFEINQGETLGIIGRNGAGKSTLLKILSRITEPTTGRVRLGGRVASLLEVGTGFHQELTGRENIFLNGAILGMRKAEIKRKFDEIVAFSEIEKFLDTPVKRYSSGMYVRLAFAVAAHLEPEILIVDEVLAVGDASFQKKCLNKMQDVGSTGRTVLFVSHSMQAVTRLCSSALLLSQGKVLGKGKTQEMIRSYLTEGNGSAAERYWEPARRANGEAARLKSVRCVNQEGVVCDSFKVNESFCVEVEYLQFDPDKRLVVSLQFINEDGTVLFVTNDWNDEEWWKTPRIEGLIKSACRIPSHLLAAGQISILVGICSYNPDFVHCLEKDAVAFHVVEDTSRLGARAEFGGSWPGVVRPELAWTAGYAQKRR